ncbi:MAG: hypothetical protein KDI19_16895, partial [Pseudomonadales bacterium]|nr:hypothetical protein [Pseudomonadales bacterium]
DEIEFEPGSIALAPPEAEKVAKLAEALSMRPALALRVPGVVATDADRHALQASRVNAEVEVEIAARGGISKEQLFTEARRDAMEALFTRRFPDESLDGLRAGFVTTTDAGESRFDEPAYVEMMRQRLIEAEAVSNDDLDALARGRASSIIDAVTADTRIDASRVSAGEIGEPARLNEAGWVPLKLEVEASRQAN